MPDREKVINALECCVEKVGTCKDNKCPYEETYGEWCIDLVLKDALALLKEQEAKEGHWIVLEYCANEGIYCSKCMNKIFDRSTKPKKKLSNYCPNCGSKNTHFFNPSTEKIMYSD